MITLQSAENALKNVYLGLVANQINIAADPLLAQIKHSTSNIYGKEIRKAAPVGINGGIGAGDEDGELPNPSPTQYAQFVAELKNLYGTFQISDKALRATSNNVNSFVNLLTDEMDNLIKSSNFNLSRMLYGDGSGSLCLGSTRSIKAPYYFEIGNRINNLAEGMQVEYYDENNENVFYFTVSYVDLVNKRMYIKESELGSFNMGSDFYLRGAKDKEITGIEGIFSKSTLYGLSKEENPWLKPYDVTTDVYISDTQIQNMIDFLEDHSNSQINYIATTKPIRRLYQEYLGAYRRNIDVTELKGGFKTITYNGIPVVGDRFVKDNTMYFLNTNDFTLYEMCDWKWLEDESGRVLKQIPNYPAYQATLVKYAELVCDRPGGQGKFSKVASTLTPPET